MLHIHTHKLKHAQAYLKFHQKYSVIFQQIMSQNFVFSIKVYNFQNIDGFIPIHYDNDLTNYFLMQLSDKRLLTVPGLFAKQNEKDPIIT